MLFLALTYPTALLSGLKIIAVFNEIQFYKKRLLEVSIFKLKNSNTSPLFKQNSILKFQDKICLENISFFSKFLSNLSSSVFDTSFSFSSDQDNYEASSSTQGNLITFFYKAVDMGIIQ